MADGVVGPDLLRTPDVRFQGLPQFPFAPHYVDVDGLRIHHLDEGDAEDRAVLLLHGEPSWSYLYRSMVPTLVGASLRCVAPDLVGFGRSDKPVLQEMHSYNAHVEWMRRLVVQLDLHDIVLVCQDWGGLIGLRVLAAEPQRFAAVIAANTALPTGEHDPGDAFRSWQRFSQEVAVFDCGAVVDMGTTSTLDPAVLAAYNAPFPDDRYLAGPRVMPRLVPTSPDAPAAAENRAAWEVLQGWEQPFVCAFSDSDPVTRGYDRPFRQLIPGAQHDHHYVIAGAGHFLQEDAGPAFAAVVAEVAAGLD